MLKILSLPLAFLAYTLLSFGFILMKKGIGWIGRQGPRDRLYYQDLLTWAGGFLLINLYIVPSTLALKHLDPHIVSATAGWGVIVLVFLSWNLLGERLFRSDALHTALIVASIVALNLFERGEAREEIVNAGLYVAAAVIPVLLLLPAFLKAVSGRARALLWAVVSGLGTAMVIVTMKVLVIFFGLRVHAYFRSPFLYAYLGFSLGAFLALQAAYRQGAMLRVGPVQYSAAILYPVLCAVPVFGDRLNPVQFGAIAVIVYAVCGMLNKR